MPGISYTSIRNKNDGGTNAGNTNPHSQSASSNMKFDVNRLTKSYATAFPWRQVCVRNRAHPSTRLCRLAQAACDVVNHGNSQFQALPQYVPNRAYRACPCPSSTLSGLQQLHLMQSRDRDHSFLSPPTPRFCRRPRTPRVCCATMLLEVADLFSDAELHGTFD